MWKVKNTYVYTVYIEKYEGKRELRCSGLLCTEKWQFVIEASGRTVGPIFNPLRWDRYGVPKRR
jgi:hypothetical protein